MQTFDIQPLFRSSQRVWDELGTKFDQIGYPDYDILRTGENDYRVTLAVPGFRQSEITVETRENALWVSGQKEVDPNHNQYLFRGIRDRQFERSFQLPEHMKVTGARIDAGLLHIELVREIPEELLPRRIEVSTEGHSEPLKAVEAA